MEVRDRGAKATRSGFPWLTAAHPPHSGEVERRAAPQTVSSSMSQRVANRIRRRGPQWAFPPSCRHPDLSTSEMPAPVPIRFEPTCACPHCRHQQQPVCSIVISREKHFGPLIQPSLPPSSYSGLRGPGGKQTRPARSRMYCNLTSPNRGKSPAAPHSRSRSPVLYRVFPAFAPPPLK